MNEIPKFRDDERFIAGVSSGPDSMAMLDIYKKNIVAVCFVNYYDRDDTYIDAKIIKKYCQDNKIKLHVLDVTKEIYDKYPYNNYQDQCRKIRYNFFNEIGNIYDVKQVLIGHNYNDFLETAYEQIVHNKKSLFLGIKPISNYKNIKIIRPLINQSKESLKRYCDNNNIKYMIDKTNSMDIYKRNINRKLLSRLNKETLTNLVNYINSYNTHYSEIEKEITELYKEWKKLLYSISFFKKLSYFNQYHIIYLYLSNNFVSKINRNKIEQIIGFVLSPHYDHHYRLSRNIFLSKKNHYLKIVRGV